jgi:hypothetical protein
MYCSHPRVALQGHVKLRPRHSEMPLLLQNQSEVIAGFGAVWLEANGLLVLLTGLLEAPLQMQDMPQTIVCRGRVGLEAECHTIGDFSRLDVPLLPQRCSQILVQHRDVWS